MRLEQWSYCKDTSNPFRAPEDNPYVLRGIVYGHPRLPDGGSVITSAVIGWNDETKTVVTFSGSAYSLGEVDPQYEAEYPDAMNRLINTLKEY